MWEGGLSGTLEITVVPVHRDRINPNSFPKLTLPSIIETVSLLHSYKILQESVVTKIKCLISPRPSMLL